MRRQPPIGGAGHVVVTTADTGGDHLLDAGEQRLERVGQLGVGDVELGGDHPAADVDANCGRDHGPLGRDHRPNRRADADVRVGHEGDVSLDNRQPSSLLRLTDGSRIDVACPGDELVVEVGRHVTLLSLLVVPVIDRFRVAVLRDWMPGA